MKNRYDVECFIDNLLVFLKANLNNKLASIDLEKGGEITTELVDDNAYIFQSLDNMPVNFDPILFYGISDMGSKSIPGASAKIFTVEISVIKTDDESTEIGKKLLRYGRALEEIFEENYFKINNVRPKIEIASLQPVSFKLQNSSNRFKAIGIEIETSIF